MPDDNTIEDLGVCGCGHAVEAHADEGCVHCDCAEMHGRETGVAPEDRVNATVETL